MNNLFFLAAVYPFSIIIAQRVDWRAGAQLHKVPVLTPIIREAINNVIKHSNATHVLIKLSKEDGGQCQVVVNDNGTKMDAMNNSNPSGLGLKNMKERAKVIKGTLKVHQENGYEVVLNFHQN